MKKKKKNEPVKLAHILIYHCLPCQPHLSLHTPHSKHIQVLLGGLYNFMLLYLSHTFSTDLASLSPYPTSHHTHTYACVHTHTLTHTHAHILICPSKLLAIKHQVFCSNIFVSMQSFITTPADFFTLSSNMS